MKRILCLSLCLFFVFSCKDNAKAEPQNVSKNEKIEYTSFGKEIISNDAIRAKSMGVHYETMQVGDSINSKMRAKVIGVCKAKGCWMTLDLDNGREVMVKFKDYGFFVPKDIEGKEVIVNGKAFVKEASVDELRHYADDAGKPENEIASITKAKRTFSFEADGVLIKK